MTLELSKLNKCHTSTEKEDLSPLKMQRQGVDLYKLPLPTAEVRVALI